jgi:hypothetical protein
MIQPSTVPLAASRRALPDVMKDVDGELFSGFPVGRDSDDQSEGAAVRHRVERMQRQLVTRGNRLDELRPPLLRCSDTGALDLAYSTSASVTGDCGRSWAMIG